MPQHRKSTGELVTYDIPIHVGAGRQKVSLGTDSRGKAKVDSGRRGAGEHYQRQAIGTWRCYGGYGAGADRDPNTGRQVMFNRVEGKIKGVVKRDGCVCFGS